MSKFSDFNFHKMKALVCVDFNVPLAEDYTIIDDTRMRAALPTLKKIINDGGSIVLLSHLGRPKNTYDYKYSLLHLKKPLQLLLDKEHLKSRVIFMEDCMSDAVYEASCCLKPGDVLLLDNVRFYKEEIEGDQTFAKKLARYGDVYVNDAFGVAHRKHASNAVVAQYFPKDKRIFGALMESEICCAEKVLHHPVEPFTAIIGGAKVSDKIEMIDNLLNQAQHIIIGGGMAYTFLKAQGLEIGNSLCEEDKMPLALALLHKADAKKVSIHLPCDIVIADTFSATAKTKELDCRHMLKGWMGLDIGRRTQGIFRHIILQSKTILWNGPMGVFEMPAFCKGTESIAYAIAEATAKHKAFSLVGGGDSVSAINQLQLSQQMSYVSTGGGALLEFFAGKILPAVSAMGL